MGLRGRGSRLHSVLDNRLLATLNLSVQAGRKRTWLHVPWCVNTPFFGYWNKWVTPNYVATWTLNKDAPNSLFLCPEQGHDFVVDTGSLVEGVNHVFEVHVSR